MREMRMVVVTLAAGLGLLAGGAAHAQQSCEEFRRLADAALPAEVGSRSLMEGLLLPAIPQPQLVDTVVDPKALRRALKAIEAKSLARDPSDCPSAAKGRKSADGRDPDEDLDCRYRNLKTGETLDIELARGKVTYLNPERQYDGAAGLDNEVEDGDAQGTAMSAVTAFGVQPAEVVKLRAKRLKAASVPVVNDVPQLADATVHVAEVHVLGTRAIGGTPVHGSALKAVVDARGKIARLHLRWPRFCVVPGLDKELASTLLSREQVLEEMVETLGEGSQCGTLSRLSARIMYVRGDESAEGAEAPERGDESPTGAGAERCYIPALVLQATPVEPEEDSGQISMGAPEFVVPLLRGRSDASMG